MTPVLTLVNHKGGCGKTSTAVNLAAEFGKLGKRVLLIDLDPQANASQHVGIHHPSQVSKTICDVFTHIDDKEICLATIQHETVFPNVSLIGSSLNLMVIEQDVIRHETRPNEMLVQFVQYVEGMFDLIILDTPPNLGLYNKNAITVATHYIIPMKGSSVYDLYGADQLVRHVRKVSAHNPNLQFLGGLLIAYSPSHKLAKLVKDETQNHLKRLLPLTIPDSTALPQSAYAKTALSEAGKSYKASTAYLDLANYLMPTLFPQQAQEI